MAKAKDKGAAAKVAALSPEEFQKLTPEEQAKYLSDLQSANASLQSANDKLATDLASAQAEATKEELPSFEVEEDKDNEIEGGEYQFTCPTFHWDDNRVIDVRELMAAANGKDAKLAEKANVIVAELVKRKSGIVRRKEVSDE